MPQLFRVAAFALFGLLFGSFANVVIWRVPRNESVVSPGSHCPSCGTAIAWYDNIPMVSWLVLGAKCRHCGTRITARYIIVEALSGALFAVAALAWSGPQSMVAAAFLWLLLVLSAIDLDCRRLPNPLVALLAAIGVLGAVAAQVTGAPLVPLVGLPASGALASPALFSLAGAILGAGMSGGIAALYYAVRRKTGLGMGDIKLLGALGLFLGPYVFVGLFMASLAGIVLGLVAARGGALSESRIPFGPALAAGAAAAALVGPELVAWYLGLVGVL